MNKTHEASKPGRVMNSLTTYTASEARNRFSDIFNEAHYGKPVLIDKHGRKVAVVSMSVLERLADLEACIDSMQAQQALEEFQRTGGKTMEEIEKELGLE